jgi:small nuclear ribonucleoprotein (snRNP)-like protein
MSSAEDLVLFNKRVPKIQKSLGILLVSLQGESVVVELKNDIEISGMLEEADENMNMTLHNAEQVFPNGKVRHLDIAFVNGSMIRYVHIAPEINAVRHLNDYVRMSMCDINVIIVALDCQNQADIKKW